ncbi:hypothetical protein HYQ46_011157 [Verticillium longisporum]|nr:hypothetical protein HYQ46_011157 [Verticillium longisporum]
MQWWVVVRLLAQKASNEANGDLRRRRDRAKCDVRLGRLEEVFEAGKVRNLRRGEDETLVTRTKVVCEARDKSVSPRGRAGIHNRRLEDGRMGY